MSRYRKDRLISWGLVGLVLTTAGITSRATRLPADTALFLLAGTPTPNDISSFPVSLYAVAPDHSLKLVREIVSSESGLYDIRDDMADNIYVAYPHTRPQTVSIIHKEEPGLKDEVEFNSEALTVYEHALGVATENGRRSSELFALIKLTGPNDVSSSLVSVRGDSIPNGPRVARDQWSEYRFFRYEGSIGGSLSGGDVIIPVGKIAGHNIVVPDGAPFNGTAQIPIAPVPSFLPARKGPPDVYIVAASQRFFAFAFPDEPGSESPTPIFVHDATLDSWKQLVSPAAVVSPRRLFGSWLTTVVWKWRLASESPGPEMERDKSGTLILDNLEDGKRITLETHQEDSEVLDVRADGLVLYRVNDRILQAHINGSQLTGSDLIVKGDGVPKVHWVFWSAGLD